jgi:hypothetical protein
MVGGIFLSQANCLVRAKYRWKLQFWFDGMRMPSLPQHVAGRELALPEPLRLGLREQQM